MLRSLTLVCACLLALPAYAGNVTSKKTGATATVGSAYAAKFQAYVDFLEAGGASIRFMGGVRKGRCRSGSLHPCGKALDVCQLRRGVVDRRCNLPDRATIAVIARNAGLFEGGQWCNHDYGHVQVGGTACSERRTARARANALSREAFAGF